MENFDTSNVQRQRKAFVENENQIIKKCIDFQDTYEDLAKQYWSHENVGTANRPDAAVEIAEMLFWGRATLQGQVTLEQYDALTNWMKGPQQAELHAKEIKDVLRCPELMNDREAWEKLCTHVRDIISKASDCIDCFQKQLEALESSVERCHRHFDSVAMSRFNDCALERCSEWVTYLPTTHRQLCAGRQLLEIVDEYLEARVDQALEEGEVVDVPRVYEHQEMEMGAFPGGRSERYVNRLLGLDQVVGLPEAGESVEGDGELEFNEYEQLEYTDEEFEALPEVQEMLGDFTRLRARIQELAEEQRQDAVGPVHHGEEG